MAYEKPARCINMNHGRMFPMVNHCPDCGIQLRAGGSLCGDDVHRARRKEGSTYCHQCGFGLKSKSDMIRRGR